MINATGAAVWESFKHPTDAILPGQVLQVGEALMANSSSTDPSLPFYQLVVEHVGLALYAYSSFTDSIPQQKQPYYVSSLNAKQDVEGVTTTCLHPAMVTFDGTQGLVVSYDMSLTFPSVSSSALCRDTYGKTTFILSNNGQNIHQQFIRLDTDGNLRLYVYTANSTDWQVVASISNTLCDLPGACGKYGICFRDQCTCSDLTKVQEEPVESSTSENPAALFLSCKPPNATAAPEVTGVSALANCTTPSEPGHMQEIVTVASADYFSNQYVTPDYFTPTISECGQRCLNSCSCTASFYRNDSGGTLNPTWHCD